MALNTSKCNHLTPLPFKGLNGQLNERSSTEYRLDAVSESESAVEGDAGGG